ncbi:MAG: alpha/beta fold hydrolase [Geminicoccaceae bacterium]
MSEPSFIDHDGERLAYIRTEGRAPEILFCPGFRSDMTGSKALAIEAHCRERGLACTRFDYSGHGASSGRFEAGTIGRWASDAIAVLDQVVHGPAVVVGSSMGGWIMLLMARARPGRIQGLVGIAPAPDFTEDLVWEAASPQQREVLLRQGVWLQPSAYDEAPTPITKALVEDGRNHLLLRAPLAVHCPVHLIHGMVDPDVPWRTSLRIAEKLRSEKVVVELVKDGEHRLSRDEDIARILAAVDEIASVR